MYCRPSNQDDDLYQIWHRFHNNERVACNSMFSYKYKSTNIYVKVQGTRAHNSNQDRPSPHGYSMYQVSFWFNKNEKVVCDTSSICQLGQTANFTDCLYNQVYTAYKHSFITLPTIVVCWYPLQTVWNQFRPKAMLGLIWIQTVWRFGGFPKRIFRKSWFRKNQQARKNHAKLPSRQRVKMGVGINKHNTLKQLKSSLKFMFCNIKRM